MQWLQQQPKSSYTQFVRDALQPVRKRLPAQNEKLRQFIDAQLLISAQTTSQQANALYSAAALDLPRLGVAHLPDGMGSIAQKLAAVLSRFGGRIRYRQTVNRVHRSTGQTFEIQTERGETYFADTIIFNLPPWNIKKLMGEFSPRKLRHLPKQPQDGWGAFMVYAGIPEEIVPAGLPLHQQIIAREPLGEGNSIFISLSPTWDTGRAPQGHRAVTISTHTNFSPWWQLYQQDREAYEAFKVAYTHKIIQLSEQIIPGFSTKAALVLPGTPVTFERFTRRAWGWVGGFPQTSLFQAWGPRLAPNLWMVGDSIFPGQSVPAVALGGLRVAQGVLAALEKSRYSIHAQSQRQTARKTST
jgi:phytoene dehydrogenase-like protein